MRNIIESLREKYKSLEPVSCPYLDDAVYFTSKGFKHLIWKSGLGMRSRRVIRERLEALDVVMEIISKSGTIQEYENTGVEFLCFVAIIKNKKYKVVLMKSGNSPYKFLSVIPNIRIGVRDNYLD